MEFADLFIQPNYGDKIDSDWDVLKIERGFQEIEIRPSDLKDYDYVTLSVRTKNKVFHPELKYQIEAKYIETICEFTKTKGFWGRVKWVPKSHYLVSEKSLKKVAELLRVWTD